MTAEQAPRRDELAGVRLWAWLVVFLVFAMVCVGGATRLTESGLSITQWKPLTGALPPLNEADWQAEFELYKRIPQYAEMNADMTLAGFKIIYAWEWGHRLLARVVGAAFILPALWFWRRGRLKGEVGRWAALATVFLALEPLVGWWMVSSGLSERIEVAQDRLALHLLIAAAVLAAMIGAAVAASRASAEWARAGVRRGAGRVAALLFVQLGFGALVAGLRGGLLFNTWPQMDGQWIPDSAFRLTPWTHAMLDDAGTAQFDHRALAYVIALVAAAHAWRTLRAAPRTPSAQRATLLLAFVLAQVALGVVTVLRAAPLAEALSHQAMAMLVFGFAVYHWRRTAADSRV